MISRSPNIGPADLKTVERTLRTVYPRAVLQNPDPAAFDVWLPEDRLSSLLDEIAAIPDLSAVFEYEIGKRHILRVGLDTDPNWEELNRRLGSSARLAAVRQREEGIFYRNVLISRLGPLWTGYWNVFRVRGGKVLPELAPPPGTVSWNAIQKSVTQVLTTYGFQEIPENVRDARVRWLRGSEAGGDTSVSVYDALFSDV